MCRLDMLTKPAAGGPTTISLSRSYRVWMAGN
jgi:hypothetical protein